jgi:regulator of protease activity HflC (stomatin/prohibitin superfamily)
MWLVRRVLVGDQERVIVIRRGRFERVLEPGAYWILGFDVEIERASLRGSPEYSGAWAGVLARQRAGDATRCFTVVETGDAEVAAVFYDGKLARLVSPGRRLLYWRGAVEVTVEVYNAKAQLDVPAALVAAAARLGVRDVPVIYALVEEGKAGLLYLDGRFVRTLGAGAYAFWTAAGAVRVDTLDLRLQTLEIPGQEILTRDKVSIRVNVWVEFRIADALAAATAVKDWSGHLYRTAQLAVRQTLGRRTLDEILADKVTLDEQVAAEVRTTMETVGVRVGGMALKDIVLPGEVRDILNQVILAEKQAQANLVKRREETAATRSLLNTAKLMEENPLVVRLKELETLEKVAEKVEKISVFSGVGGLVQDLVKLRE